MNLILFFFLSSPPGFDFLTLPNSAREPFASSIGLDGAIQNPAGLVSGENGLSFTENFWLLDAKVSFLSFKSHSIGLSLSYYDFGEIEYQDNTPDDDGGPPYRPYAFVFSISKGIRIDPELSIGLKIEYFYHKIMMDEAKNILLGSGFLYEPKKIPFLRLGFSLLHFGLKTGFREVTYKMPTEIRFSPSVRVGNFEFAYEFRKIVTYQNGTQFIRGKGIEHRIGSLFETPFGIKVFTDYHYGREVDPLSIGFVFEKGKLSLSYSMRYTKLSFDLVQLISLEVHL